MSWGPSQQIIQIDLESIQSILLPSAGGNLSVVTDEEEELFTTLPTQEASQVTIINDQEAVILEVQQGVSGPAVPVLPMTAFTFFGIANANQLRVRRRGEGEPIEIFVRWEL